MTNKKYFYGNEISDYGMENGFVDYRTLSKCFNAVLNNDIMENFIDDWELWSGLDYNDEEDTFAEIFQYYIIDEQGAELLARETNEIVYYNWNLDMYVWGVTHYGTAWDYVLTNIAILW